MYTGFHEWLACSRTHNSGGHLSGKLAKMPGGSNEETARPCGQCYVPWNMQATFLTCDPGVQKQWERPGSGHTLSFETAVSPSARETIARAIATLDHVGLGEYYQQSVCLATYQVTGAAPEACFCKRDAVGTPLSSTRGLSHVSHGAANHSIVDVPAETLALIDGMTVVDRMVYATAKERLFADLSRMEAVTKRSVCVACTCNGCPRCLGGVI